MSLFLISIQNKVDFSRSKEVNYLDLTSRSKEVNCLDSDINKESKIY